MQRKSVLPSFALLATLSVLLPSLAACTHQMDQGSSVDSSETSVSLSHDMGDMDLGPKDEAFDLRFIDGMILHHEGAIAMAEEALAKSSREEIRKLAQAILAAQQTEIAQMQQWRQDWYPDAGPEPMMYYAEMGHMMAMDEAMKLAMRMDVDLGDADEQFDRRFLEAMIPHHEGALVMAEQVLERSDRAEMQALARTILTTQQQEIEQMQMWKQDWYGQ